MEPGPGRRREGQIQVRPRLHGLFRPLHRRAERLRRRAGHRPAADGLFERRQCAAQGQRLVVLHLQDDVLKKPRRSRMKSITTRIAATLLVSLSGPVSLAAVTAEEAKMLGTTHTPWGALIAGNKEG